MKSKYIFLFLGIGLLLALLFVGNRIVSTNFETSIPQERPCPFQADFKLDRYLDKTSTATLEQTFPYTAYLDSANWCSIQTMIEDLDLMDQHNQNVEQNRDILATTLTEKLELRLQNTLRTYKPDSLIFLLQWAGRFHDYQELDEKNAQLYRRIYRHWFNLVSNRLGQFAEQNSNIKYEFKFKYLVAYCHARMFSAPIGNSNGEKIINYILDQNYAYLFNRFWNSTGAFSKIIILLGLCFCLYALWCVYKVNFVRN